MAEEPIVDPQDDDEDAPMSPGRKVAVNVVAALAVVALLTVLSHVTAPRIRPEQKAPDGHFFEPCWVCHTVSPDAEPIEVDKK